MKLSKFAQQLEAEGIEIIFTPEEEYVSPAEMYESESDIQWVCDQAEAGNMAAWFSAKVELKFDEIVSEPDYLGCCSYKSFSEFTGENDGYFDDMLRVCYEDLQKQQREIKTYYI
jgi:hypothetical protein